MEYTGVHLEPGEDGGEGTQDSETQLLILPTFQRSRAWGDTALNLEKAFYLREWLSPKLGSPTMHLDTPQRTL